MKFRRKGKYKFQEMFYFMIKVQSIYMYNI